MGIGDELIASGIAKRILNRNKEFSMVQMLTRSSYPYYHPVWFNLDYIVQPGMKLSKDTRVIGYKVQPRPYIEAENNERFIFKKWYRDNAKGMIAFNDREKEYIDSLKKHLGNYLVISPFIKPRASINKQWGIKKFQYVIDKTSDIYRWVQPIEFAGAFKLTNTIGVKSYDIRDYLCLIAGSKGVLTNEGATHHIAGILDIPGIVIFGCYIAPSITGYSCHTNIYSGKTECGCGYKIPSECCNDAMNDIYMEHVAGLCLITFKDVRNK